jgi:peptidoglycan/xylan/chitin deacetylase (PgdA/CDA1 family)
MHHHGKRALATVYTKCTTANTVALTFDDGPWVYEGNIIDQLNAAGAKGTFFVNGNNYQCIYDQAMVTLIKKAHSGGHQLGSHTWRHKDLTTLTWDQIHDEMWKTELALQKILGVSPGFMRPPYGNYNDLVRTASASRNQSLVIWDFDSGDSVGATPAQSKQRYTTVANQRPSNILTLNHETVQTTSTQVLPHAISVLKAKGYSFVTVPQCLGKTPYKASGTTNVPGTRDSTWKC